MDDRTIISVMDSETGEKVELEVIEELNLNNNHYALLAPLDDEEEAYVYKVIGEGTEATYEMVEDEDEFNAVVAEYDKLFDEEMNN